MHRDEDALRIQLAHRRRNFPASRRWTLARVKRRGARIDSRSLLMSLPATGATVGNYFLSQRTRWSLFYEEVQSREGAER